MWKMLLHLHNQNVMMMMVSVGGTKGLKHTFSEVRHVAYKIKGCKE